MMACTKRFDARMDFMATASRTVEGLSHAVSLMRLARELCSWSRAVRKMGSPYDTMHLGTVATPGNPAADEHAATVFGGGAFHRANRIPPDDEIVDDDLSTS